MTDGRAGGREDCPSHHPHSVPLIGAGLLGELRDIPRRDTYGGGTYTGNLTLPAASTVESGIHFGANGTQYTGTLVAASRAVAYGFSR